jgi:hypothetical protein
VRGVRECADTGRCVLGEVGGDVDGGDLVDTRVCVRGWWGEVWRQSPLAPVLWYAACMSDVMYLQPQQPHCVVVVLPKTCEHRHSAQGLYTTHNAHQKGTYMPVTL